MPFLKNFFKRQEQSIIYPIGIIKFKLVCVNCIVDKENPRNPRIILTLIAT